MSWNDSAAYSLVRCDYCNGIATAVRYHPLIQGHICLDQELCEKIKVYEVMLLNVKSA